MRPLFKALDFLNAGNQVWIETDYFEVLPGEEEETNPGIFGKAYAEWLAHRFRDEGEEVAEVIPEDWGWCVVLRRKPYLLFIACRNAGGDNESEFGPTEWAAFVAAEPGLIQRLVKRVDPAAEIARLSKLLESIAAQAPGVKRVWFD